MQRALHDTVPAVIPLSILPRPPAPPRGLYRKDHLVHLRQRGRVFYADYMQNGKRVKESLKTDNRKAAELLRSEIEYKLRAGLLKKPVEIRLDEFVKEYVQHLRTVLAHKNASTQAGYLNRFAARFPTARLSHVTTAAIEQFICTAKNGTPAPKTWNNLRGYFHAMFAYAKRHSYAFDNPAAAVDRRREVQRTIRFLKTDEEIETLLKLFDGDPLQAMVATYVFAGIRRAEACWLTWDDIDLGRKVIHIRAKEVNGKRWCPKTKRNRVVPIAQRLLPYLHEQSEITGESPWVFLSPQDLQCDPNLVTRRFRAITRRAKLSWTLLDLRHTFGSRLAMKGVSLYKIATFMGNSPQICQRHYVALVPEQLHKDVEF